MHHDRETRSTYSRRRGIVWRLAADRIVLRDAYSTGTEAHQLHSATAVVWDALEAPLSRDQLVEQVAQAGSASAASDVDVALRDLLAAGLIEELR